MHINAKAPLLNRTFRKYFGPIHMYPLFENDFFCYLIYWFCFVFSGLAYRSLVSGDNSNRKRIFSKCFPKWRLLNTFASRLRVNGRKQRF